VFHFFKVFFFSKNGNFEAFFQKWKLTDRYGSLLFSLGYPFPVMGLPRMPYFLRITTPDMRFFQFFKSFFFFILFFPALPRHIYSFTIINPRFIPVLHLHTSVYLAILPYIPDFKHNHFDHFNPPHHHYTHQHK